MLLRALVDRAVAETASDAGGVMFLAHPERDELYCEFGAGGETGGRDELAAFWRRERSRLARALPAAGGGVSVGVVPIGDDRLTLSSRSRVCARAALLAAEGDAAMLQVERLGGRYTRKQLRSLERLARYADILIARALLSEHAARQGLDLHWVGASPKLLSFESKVRAIAKGGDDAVLISGERGSGKELAAYAVHYFSGRRARPFVAINSAALSKTLFADELFGHEPGAYTGAEGARRGVLQAADEGTLFFDEIGDMSPHVQASLLRFLDDGQVRKIGSDETVRVDIRVIAATNRNLRSLVREGLFRADVLDRLEVFKLKVPPLRERKEDLHLLVNYFLKKACAHGDRASRIQNLHMCATCQQASAPSCAHTSLYTGLEDYDFPGNVRELRNIIMRLATLVEEDEIDRSHLASHQAKASRDPVSEEDLTLAAVVRRHIADVLESEGQNKSAAARTLGLPLSTLINKMKRLRM